MHVVVDSTGVKVFGEGEWKVRQHGYSKRRTWKKLHVGVDEATGDTLGVAMSVTDNSAAEPIIPLRQQLKFAAFLA